MLPSPRRPCPLESRASGGPARRPSHHLPALATSARSGSVPAADGHKLGMGSKAVYQGIPHGSPKELVGNSYFGGNYGNIMAGWWLSHPSEKYIWVRQLRWLDIPNWTEKHPFDVPNYQPDLAGEFFVALTDYLVQQFWMAENPPTWDVIGGWWMVGVPRNRT